MPFTLALFYSSMSGYWKTAFGGSLVIDCLKVDLSSQSYAESMPVSVHITVSSDPSREEVFDLILTSKKRSWRKRYFGKLFLLFDAQELGLIEEGPVTGGGDHGRAALRNEATVDEAKLLRMDFSESTES